MVDALLGRMGRVLDSGAPGNGRSLAYVWGIGSLCLTITIVLPHPAGAHMAGLVGVAVAGYLGAAVLFATAATLPQAALEAFTYSGQLLITVLTFSWGAPDAPFLWFHVWLVVHAFHFLAPSRASRQIVFASILYVVATIETHSGFPAVASVVGVGTITAIGLLVGAFRARVDELLATFARIAAADPLTGLPNRRAFTEAFVNQRARSARTGDRGALLLLDCDQLKEINDCRGHAAGDRALQRVADAISGSIREVDTPARIGGDEFAVLLSAPEPGGAAAVSERIRNSLLAGEDPELTTLSIGVIELPPDQPITLEAALHAADGAMYESKNQGGDRISVGVLEPPLSAVPPLAARA